MTYVITRKTIYSVVLFFMVFVVALVRLSYFQYYNILRYTFIVLSFLFLLLNYRIVFKKKYLKIDILLLSLCAVLLLSSYINAENAVIRNPLPAAIVFCAATVLLFFAAQYAIETGYVNLMVSVFLFLCVFNIVITDILIIAAPGLLEENSNYYFIGNKFTVIFTHYFMIGLFFCRRKKNENKALKMFIGFLMLIWTLVMAVIVDCATGIVGCFVLAGLLFIQLGNVDLCNKRTFLIVSAIVSAFPFMFALIVSIPFVQSILYSLGRSLSMTGRQGIFVFALKFILNSPYIGFGFATSYELGMRVNGTSSTENCYIEWLWQAGIIGFTILILLLLAVISTANKHAENKKSYAVKAINAVLYTYLLLGSTTPTINEVFFGIEAIMLAAALPGFSNTPNKHNSDDMQSLVSPVRD